MSEFLAVLSDPDIAFMRYALIAGILASVSFGVVGTYVVARRISYIAGAISHSVLGGIGIALYLQRTYNLPWCHPIHGAILAALAAAVIIGLVSLYAKEREDTAIGALWAAGMAVGLLFLARTPGYVDPMSYLFGNITLIPKSDLYLIAALDVLIVAVSLVFYNKFLAVCFDEEFARLRGAHVGLFYVLLLCLAALTVVLLVTVVGIVMVIALLTLPAAVAARLSRRLWQMMLLSVLFCLLFTSTGLAVSFQFDLTPGPTIILIAAAAYLLLILLRRRRKPRTPHQQPVSARKR